MTDTTEPHALRVGDYLEVDPGVEIYYELEFLASIGWPSGPDRPAAPVHLESIPWLPIPS